MKRTWGSSTQRAVSLLGIMAAGAILHGCGEKEAKGQVVGVVNGIEVTRRELAAEPEIANLGPGIDAQPLLPQILGQVIDRKLVVAEAEKLKLDERPEFQTAKRRLEEVLLSQQLLQTWAREVPQPKPEEIKTFIAANPQMFGNRKLLLMDQIVAMGKVDAKDLGPLNTPDEIAAYFNAKKIKFQRKRAPVDSADMPLVLFRQFMKAPPGAPIAVIQPSRVDVYTMLRVQDSPVPAAQADAIAKAALAKQAVGKRIQAMRKSAKITYQPGYEPPKAPAKGAGSRGTGKDKGTGTGTGATMPDGMPAPDRT